MKNVARLVVTIVVSAAGLTTWSCQGVSTPRAVPPQVVALVRHRSLELANPQIGKERRQPMLDSVASDTRSRLRALHSHNWSPSRAV